ncbi:MAG TPA: DNA-processing protein DprA [Marmoricola sp.]|nr:DNA-processing protein DprA [Marmoricola sp.]
MTATEAGARVVGEDERLARIALNTIGEPGDPRLTRLVEAMGPVELHDRLLADVGLSGLRSETAARLEGLDPRRILDAATAIGVRFVVPGDLEWPEQLDDLLGVEPLNRLTGAPLGLWVAGPLDLAAVCRRSVAVVGSRSATSYGTDVAADIAVGLAAAGRSVISGAAFGIDQAAHRGALSADGKGSTVAVLACGVDRAYPTAHRDLLRHLKENGAVVSELPPGCAPTRVRFLSRNRLIAALSQGTVVVEAAVRSGALNTAGWAMRLNRPVMGVPGPVTSAPSEGVHELVRTGAATLVTRAAHVLELVSPMGSHLTQLAREEPSARDRLPPTDLRVLEAVPLVQPAGASGIARTAGLSVSDVVESLVRLRELGWVVGSAGRWRRSPDEPLG